MKETPMKATYSRSFLLACCGTAMVLGGAAFAKTQHHAAAPSDNLYLSAAQERAAWNGLSSVGTQQIPPDSFSLPGKGATIPAGVDTQPIPAPVAARVPALRGYQFTRVSDRVVIVNPTNHRVVEVISQ
jgi:hypothetical protein